MIFITVKPKTKVFLMGTKSGQMGSCNFLAKEKKLLLYKLSRTGGRAAAL